MLRSLLTSLSKFPVQISDNDSGEEEGSELVKREDYKEKEKEEDDEKSRMASIMLERKQTSSSCPFLHLPAELRNEIYTYAFTGYTIEVYLGEREKEVVETRTTSTAGGAGVQDTASHDSTSTSPPSSPKPSSASLSEFTYPLKGTITTPTPKPPTLSFRIELPTDNEEQAHTVASSKAKPSLPALFPLTQVNRELRKETSNLLLPIYTLNTFSFTDAAYNYGTALPSFIASLTLTQRSAIRSIAWPLRQAREYGRAGKIGPSASCGTENLRACLDGACVIGLKQLTGLQHVTLRWHKGYKDMLWFAGYELKEWKDRVKSSGEWDYHVEHEFKRELAVRGMRWQVGGERKEKRGLEIVCERTWRARF